MRRAARLVAATLVLAACSSGGASADPGATSSRRGGQNLITAEEIAGSGAGLENALEIVLRLRPSMTRPRGSGFGVNNQAEQIPVLVYVNDVRLGMVDDLRTIPTTQVHEIRYVSATDATQRWGTGHSSGVIQVITRR